MVGIRVPAALVRVYRSGEVAPFTALIVGLDVYQFPVVPTGELCSVAL